MENLNYELEKKIESILTNYQNIDHVNNNIIIIENKIITNTIIEE